MVLLGSTHIVELLLKSENISPDQIVSAHHLAQAHHLLGVQIVLEEHPVIKFMNESIASIEALKQEYKTKVFGLRYQSNRNPDETLRLEQFGNYVKGFDHAIEKIDKNPLADIKDIFRSIPAFSQNIPGQLNNLIIALKEKQVEAQQKCDLSAERQMPKF